MTVAGVEGLEPSQAVLETDVLPLTLYPYKQSKIIITQKKEKHNTFYKKFTKILKKINNSDNIYKNKSEGKISKAK